jgi:tetratricopeptide (TPR) repeat protein
MVSWSRFFVVFPVLVAVLLASPGVLAQDKIVLRNGEELVGTINEVRDGKVFVKVSAGVVPANLVDVVKVEAKMPDQVVRAREYPAEQKISTLGPLVARYKGLPIEWVVEAMSLMAEAYNATGQAAKARTVYEEMLQLYPNSRFEVRAKAGLAGQALDEGKYDEALAMVTPLIQEANKTLLPTAEEGATFGAAFLVRGRALEAQKKSAEALEAYLTTVTIFYQDPSTAKAAQEAAAALRKKVPGLSVE